jgi:hypothetical protein
MSRFTEFIRKYAGRAAISAEEFDRCVGELARAIRSRLEAIGMFTQPPEYFGYPEFDSWEKALDLREGPTDPVLDALAYAITDRLDSLADLLETGVATNIDGLVLLNVKHFLHERQRNQDPLGHAVFENLEAALLRLRDAGVMTFVGLVRGKVRNPTVLRFSPGSAFPATADEISGALEAEPEFARLYPHLGHANVKAQAVLADLLPALPRVGIAACHFRDLVNAIKERVRGAYAGRNRPAESEAVRQSAHAGDFPELIRIVRPDTSYMEREAYEAFLRHVPELIAQLPQERTRRGVTRMFEEVLRYREVDEELPPVEELGRRLGIAKSTAHEHRQKLGEIVREAQEGH